METKLFMKEPSIRVTLYFMEVGARVGINNMYKYFKRLGLFNKTNIDVPGEASSIMHKAKNVGQVGLATISFSQSFQITPMQLLVATSAAINGGTLVTPHFGKEVTNSEQKKIKDLKYKKTIMLLKRNFRNDEDAFGSGSERWNR